MPAPYTISNPNVQRGNGVVDISTVDDGVDTGNIAPNAKCIAFYNNGDGSGGGSDAYGGVAGLMKRIPAGTAKNYPVVMGPNGVYEQEFEWDADGNDLLITVVF